jgi:aryl-alcohol dehydrogenase-like predicted oxidoreductase
MKIILGTAQLGLNYGITNQYGKPSVEKSLSIIKAALDNNINVFDTARGYGDSEKILGIAKEKYQNIKIITKLDPLHNLNENSTGITIELLVNNSINTSLKLLNIDKIEVLLLHRFNHYQNVKIWNTLLEKKKNGIIEKLGVSVYYVDEAIQALKDKDIKHIQLPINILDNQWFNSQFQDLLKSRKDVTIHCRSIFLQGILISSKEKWPKLKNINSKEYVDNLEFLVKKFDFSNKIELCLSYIKSIEWIDGLLMGVDSIEQLEENIELFRIRQLSQDEFNSVRQIFKNTPRNLLNPSMW